MNTVTVRENPPSIDPSVVDFPLARRPAPIMDGINAPARVVAFSNWLSRPSSAGLLFWGLAALLGVYGLATDLVDADTVLGSYAIEVVVILICLEVYTTILLDTGILDRVSLRLAEFSGGNLFVVAGLFITLMYVVSALLNNLAAAMVTVPVLLQLLRALQIRQTYLNLLLGLLLPIINLGGASTPMGDFPAVIIFASGLTTFNEYLFHALPLFASTAVGLVAVFALSFGLRLHVDQSSEMNEQRELTVQLMQAANEHTRLSLFYVVPLASVFVGMWLGWAFLPSVSPMLIAIVGALAAMLVAGQEFADKLLSRYDASAVFNITGVLAIASVVQATGWLEVLANQMVTHIADPVLLLMVMMLVVTLASGVLSAGPAAAAMLPLVEQLVSGPLANEGQWVVTGFAAAICAGSSLFLWSATSGLKLWSMVREADLADADDQPLSWGVVGYLRYGMLAAAVQLLIAISWIGAVLRPDAAMVSLATVLFGMLLFVLGMFWRRNLSARQHRQEQALVAAAPASIGISMFLNVVGVVLTALGLWLQVNA